MGANWHSAPYSLNHGLGTPWWDAIGKRQIVRLGYMEKKLIFGGVFCSSSLRISVRRVERIGKVLQGE